MATLASPTAIPTKRPDQTDEEFAALMQSLGYRQVTRWVPDTSNPAFKAEYRRQLAGLSAHQRAHPEELIELTPEDVEGWE
jgi:predicted secreted Zn-dependent protease